jgi:hypothetical protein
MFPRNVIRIAKAMDKLFPKKVYFVGGCLRDSVFEKPIADYDIAVTTGDRVWSVSPESYIKNALSEQLFDSPLCVWTCHENYDDSMAGNMEGVFKVEMVGGNKEKVDIIIVDNIKDYVKAFPCNISQITMNISSGKLEHSRPFERAIDSKEVVWYPKSKDIPKEYYTKIVKKYNNYKHIITN